MTTSKAKPKRARRAKVSTSKSAKKPAAKSRSLNATLETELVEKTPALKREELDDTAIANRADAARLLTRSEAALRRTPEQVAGFNLLLNEVSFNGEILIIEQARNSLRWSQEYVSARDYDEARKMAGIGSRAFLQLSDPSRAQHLLLMVELLTVRATCSLHSKNNSDAKRCLKLMMGLQRKYNRAQVP